MYEKLGSENWCLFPVHVPIVLIRTYAGHAVLAISFVPSLPQLSSCALASSSDGAASVASVEFHQRSFGFAFLLLEVCFRGGGDAGIRGPFPLC